MQASEVITKTILYGSDFMKGGIFMLNQERDKHKLLTQSQKNIIGPSKHQNQPHTLSKVVHKGVDILWTIWCINMRKPG